MTETTNSQCRRCGACCSQIGTPPFLPKELKTVPPGIRHISDWFFQNDDYRSETGMPCYFFSFALRKCLIQEHKPKVCKEFEPEGDGCREWRKSLFGVEDPDESVIADTLRRGFNPTAQH